MIFQPRFAHPKGPCNDTLSPKSSEVVRVGCRTRAVTVQKKGSVNLQGSQLLKW